MKRNSPGLRRYESVIVIRSDLTADQTKEIFKRLESAITAQGGWLINFEDWGTRELAYKIKHQLRGHYFRIEFLAPGALIAELERMLRLNEMVLRYLTVLTDGKPDIEKLKQQSTVKVDQALESTPSDQSSVGAQAAAQSGSGVNVGSELEQG